MNIDAVIAKIERTFSEFPNERATLEDMGKVAKVRTCYLAVFSTVELWKININSVFVFLRYVLSCPTR